MSEVSTCGHAKPEDTMACAECARVRILADGAISALYDLERAIGSFDETAPNFDLRLRIFRARIAVGEVAHAFKNRSF